MALNIPGYRIVKPLAEGGMASVYLAVQESLGRRVVLKLLKKFTDVYQSARFVNEAKIIASLNHRNIITIHDIGVVGERHYISMEFLEGGDLEYRIIEGMSADAALTLVESLGSCLDFVHRKNIVHRDIKPANILFHSDGTPILTDFGVAKHQELDARLTKDGTALGSPFYISPEQAECKTLDGRADIYSLGIILYEMLTGARPYDGGSDIQIIISHLSDPVPSLPPGLGRYQELIDRMIAKSPDDRFSTAGEMVEYIRKIRPSGSRTVTAVDIPDDYHGMPDAGPVPADIADQGAGTAFPGMHDHRTAGRRMLVTGALTVLFAIAVTFFVFRPSMFPAANHTVSTGITMDALQPPPLDMGENAEARHEEYLLKARLARQKLRFATPKHDSAYYYYRKILDEDPDHKEALRGVEEIADIYADLVEWALGMLQHQKAKEYLDTGLQVDPGNERLQGLARGDAFK